MRWGIETESSDRHNETEICMNEIDQCRKYSLATNFVVKLDRYCVSKSMFACSYEECSI